MTKKIYGIDLGITYSAIASVNNSGEAEMIPNMDEDNITPSVVHFESPTIVIPVPPDPPNKPLSLHGLPSHKVTSIRKHLDTVNQYLHERKIINVLGDRSRRCEDIYDLIDLKVDSTIEVLRKKTDELYDKLRTVPERDLPEYEKYLKPLDELLGECMVLFRSEEKRKQYNVSINKGGKRQKFNQLRDQLKNELLKQQDKNFNLDSFYDTCVKLVVATNDFSDDEAKYLVYEYLFIALKDTFKELEAERKKAAKEPAMTPLSGQKAGERLVIPIKILQFPFRWCPSGTFTMGDGNDAHKVTLTKGFWMGETQVTQDQWQAVTGKNPSWFKDGGYLPVEQVTWNDCQKFVKKLNTLKVAPSGFKFALPSEAQWEYACRAGTTTAYCFGDSESQLGDYAWYSGYKDFEEWSNSEEYKNGTYSKWGYITHEVGTKEKNAWGLYDMHGNVWEWCQDWYGDYPKGDVVDPTGASSGSLRVNRGGGWCNDAGWCQSAYRGGGTSKSRRDLLGLRVALVSEGK